MVNKQKKKAKSGPVSKGTVITVAIMALAIAGGVYYVLNSHPINSPIPNFSPPSNVYILAIHNDQGYAYDQQSTKTGKKSLSGQNIDPAIHIPKGILVSLHVINEDKDTGSDHDLNIDAFNVHTKHLKYFEAQTINFLADKEGTYPYYSTIHPEMKGTITVDP